MVDKHDNSDIKEVLMERTYKAGYVLKKCLIDGTCFSCDDFVVTLAYTLDGHYIGDSKTAHFLCKQKGIKPELRTPESQICTVGFCEREQKWYGWSHRAIYGFGIGSTVLPGDVGYIPVDKHDFYRHAKAQFADPVYRNLRLQTELNGVWVIYDVLVESNELKHHEDFEPYPEKWGRGEWTAQTLEEAKEMACLFAEAMR